MAEKINNNGEDMSVDELVSRLRDNISSAEIPKDDSDSEQNKTIAKKSDPDKDIASMLKKFMPEESEDDFELDDSIPAESDDFELEGEGEFEASEDVLYEEVYSDYEGEYAYAYEDGVEYVEEDGVTFVDENGEEVAYVDENGEYYAPEELEYEDGSEEYSEEYYEEAAQGEEEFILSEDEAILEALSFDGEEEPTKKKSLFGGFFGFGKKKSDLADGYAKMLETEELASDEAYPEETYTEEVYSEDISEDASGVEYAEAYADNFAEGYAEQEDISDIEMPELSDISLAEDVLTEEYAEEYEEEYEEAYAESYDEAYAEAADDGDEIIDQPLPEGEYTVPSQMFVLDNPQENVEEEEYFVSEKNPLAFDDEDETPIVPDESAFADVGPSDISELVAEDGTYSEDEDFEEYTEEEAATGELGEKDIDIMIALGYEEELEKVIGKEKVDEISDNINAEIVDFIDIDSAYAFDGFEISSPDRFRAIGNRYKQEHSMMKLRLLGTGIFAIALFIFELLSMFGVTFGGALNIHHYPVVGIMLSLQLLVLASALSFRQIFMGLYDAVTFKPSPASLPAVAVLMTVIYNIVMALIAPNSGLSLYNFPAALCLVFLVLGDYFNLSREIRAFNTMATRRPKYAVSTIKTEAEQDAEHEMMEIFSSEETAAQNEKMLEVNKVGFIENYFRRTNIRSSKDRRYCLAIYPFIALAIALGIVSFVTNRSGITAFNVSILTVLFGMPMSAMFIGSYPFFSAVNTAFEKDATIIGEESVEEYSDASTVIFSDKEVFPVEATVTRGIKLYDNNAIYYVLYHLTSLYSKIGGPLKTRLEQATTEMGYSSDVQIMGVYEKGVEALVDGKVNVLAGQAVFMQEMGIDVGYDPDDAAMLAQGATALYLVLDGVLSAKLYVNYNLDPEFESVIATLNSENMEALIRTCDPNIDDELLASKLLISKFPARIVKCRAEDNEDKESAESGIIARDSLTALAKAITLCNKVRRVRRTSKTVSIISMVVSAIMMVFLSLFSSKLGVPSIYVALYQIFWMIPMVLFTKLYVK